MKVRLGSQAVTIQAPVPSIQTVFVFGLDNQTTGSHPSKDDEGAKVLEREGNRLLLEFTSRDGRKLYKI